ncbi:protein-tyrosine phosphatase [Sporothrix schenckii 1099-18]|uniref:phosphatidylinositol-3,4,5-trisphosphate 3-phosphatase n=1 Tax=Sporothrix schenckii 1099-18 TaxID=1397361 RepID=A0A0F2M179_SPOSC|nr:protein-tyrosine phosphatase [Sporothrix schenckii 1099-18]KJR81926.1 protein-tyrosine phosphatase [Sporothrix schenckii 1099-18]
MASLLRQIVAGPRARHDETGLDLCYVTSNIIATSGPSITYPQLAYRNPLDRLVAFLDRKHGDGWAIWEFRAEGTGYPDEAVYGRIRHYPWPDHHPPPFRLVPLILASMKQWLGDEYARPPGADGKQGQNKGAKGGEGGDKKTGRVAVVHCKAGKGRSGTMACSYLIAECGWTPKQALDRFTERRMRPKFGSGVTIPSQLRWITYVDRWVRAGKPAYVDRAVEIVEIHFRGLRHGVKLAVEGYVDEGKQIHVFHTFKNRERYVVQGDAPGGGGLLDLVSDMAGGFSAGGGGGGSNSNNGSSGDNPPQSSRSNTGVLNSPVVDGGKIRRPRTDVQLDSGSKASKDSTDKTNSSSHAGLASTNDSGLSMDIDQLQNKSESMPALADASTSESTHGQPHKQPFRYAADDEPGGQAVIFRPEQPIRVPNGDVNISIERRNKTAANMGLTMVTSVAHVWFNTFFEGNGPEQNGVPDDSGVFVLDWDKLDGIKGSSQKGSRAAERISVVWRHVQEHNGEKEASPEMDTAAPAGATADVPQMRPANWQGNNPEDPDANKHLGLRRDDPESAGVSRASSVTGIPVGDSNGVTAASSPRHGADASKERDEDHEEALASVKTSGPEGETDLDESSPGEEEAAKAS